MVQAIIDISDEANRVLNIVKARYNLKDKSQAIEKMAADYQEAFEPDIRPEYVKKLLRIDAEPSIPVTEDDILSWKKRAQEEIKKETRQTHQKKPKTSRKSL